MKHIKFLLILLLFGITSQAQKVDNFTLKSVTDNSTFSLKKAKGDFVVLHFLLKTECPYCIRHTSEYFEKSTTLSNVTQVFIKPDNEEEIKEWAKKIKSNNSFPIYQDKDCLLYTSPSPRD